MPLKTYPNNLPHDPLRHYPIHITYRLHGSLPKQIFRQLAARRQRQLDELDAAAQRLIAEPQFKEETHLFRAKEIDDRYVLSIDEALHAMKTPESYRLMEVPIRQIVMDSWLTLQQREQVFVYALCVMGNHVHIILKAYAEGEEKSLAKVMESHKGFTARMINRQLGTTGKPFWASGYFDRRVRKGKFVTAMWYLLKNPVKAGLVEEWQSWPGTYLHPEYVGLFTEE